MASWLDKMGAAGGGRGGALPPALGDQEVLVDCSHPVAHAAEHHPHPVTGRLVCGRCHPQPETIRAAA